MTEKNLNERTARYAPKTEALPMRAGTVMDVLATLLLRDEGANMDELKAALVDKYGANDKFSSNYVGGYIWDIGKRGYGIDVDGNAKFFLVLPEGTTGLVYQEEKAKAEPAPKAEKPPKADKPAKAAKAGKGGKGKGKGKDAAPAAEGGDDDAAPSGEAPQGEGQ